MFRPSWEAAEFNNAEARALRRSFVETLAPHAAEQSAWSRVAKWQQSFSCFAERQFALQGRKFNLKEAIASDELCGLFIIAVANEDKGHTRSSAARAALNKIRAAYGTRDLNQNVQISLTIKGDKRRSPRKKKQAEGLTTQQARSIKEQWGQSRYWWRRQIALMTCLGFVTLMRLAELLALTRQGILWCMVSKEQASFAAWRRRGLGESLPSSVRGVLLHVPWRKASQHEDVWIPASCPAVLSMLWSHLVYLESRSLPAPHLFPPKRGSNVACGPKRDAAGPMKAASFRLYLCKAVQAVSPEFTQRDLRMFGGHSLRVGGSNMLRQRGVDPEIIRLMGGWASMCSTEGYMQASTSEQFGLTDQMGIATFPKIHPRRAAFTAELAKAVFSKLPSIAK